MAADVPAAAPDAPPSRGLSRRELSRAAVVVGWACFFSVVAVTVLVAPFLDYPARKVMLPVLLAIVFAAGLNLSVGGLLGIDAVFDRKTSAALMAWQIAGIVVGVWMLTFVPLMRVHFVRMLSGPPVP